MSEGTRHQLGAVVLALCAIFGVVFIVARPHEDVEAISPTATPTGGSDDPHPRGVLTGLDVAKPQAELPRPGSADERSLLAVIWPERVSGRVVRKAGDEPLRGFAVMVLDPDGGSDPVLALDHTGWLGTFSVEISPAVPRDAVLFVAGGTGDRQLESRVPLQDYVRAESRDIRFDTGWTLKAKVLWRDGTPASLVGVNVRGSSAYGIDGGSGTGVEVFDLPLDQPSITVYAIHPHYNPDCESPDLIVSTPPDARVVEVTLVLDCSPPPPKLTGPR